MSNNGFGPGNPGRTAPEIPRGDEVAVFPTSQKAQEAVTKLVQGEFPPKQIAVVGSDLHSVERVTGALSFGKIALNGAASGIWLGLFAAIFLFVISPEVAQTEMILAVIVIGAGLGAVLAVLMYQFSRRRRTYTSVVQVIASSYTVIVASGLGGKARSILGIAATPKRVAPVESAAAEPDTVETAAEPAPGAATPDSTATAEQPAAPLEDAETPAER